VNWLEEDSERVVGVRREQGAGSREQGERRNVAGVFERYTPTRAMVAP
jgi:hypothetical protein